MALNAATSNAYDITHAEIMFAALARARGNAPQAVAHALAGRRAAEMHVLVAFHFYGIALEAAARVDAGEMHAGTLLATTALGTVETLQGCEYGLEIRLLCAEALSRAGSPQAREARQKAVDYALAVITTIRDVRLRRCFANRRAVASLFERPSVPQSAQSSPLADVSSVRATAMASAESNPSGTVATLSAPVLGASREETR
jgi:hypothetical protein